MPVHIIENETGAQRMIGYVLDVGAADGGARCTLDMTEAHSNRHGVLHGGIAMAMLDNALGATASLSVDASGRAPFLTISLTTHFLAPARVGTRLSAHGRVVGGGRATLFLEGTLHDGAATIIATASGVYRRVSEERRGTEETEASR